MTKIKIPRNKGKKETRPEVREKIRQARLKEVANGTFRGGFKKGHGYIGGGFKKGTHSSWNAGKKLLQLSGENSGMWRGDNAGYSAIHYWIYRQKGKPNHCEICGTKEKRKYNWANIDHEYKRDVNDYIAMCVPCHRKYDKENNSKK